MINLKGNVTTKDGKITGLYEVIWDILSYKKIGSWDFQPARPISDKEYYDEYDGKFMKIRDSFNGHVVLLCEANQCLLEIIEEGSAWTVIEHQYGGDSRGNIHGEDLGGIMFRLKSAKHMDLIKQYYDEFKGTI